MSAIALISKMTALKKDLELLQINLSVLIFRKRVSNNSNSSNSKNNNNKVGAPKMNMVFPQGVPQHFLKQAMDFIIPIQTTIIQINPQTQIQTNGTYMIV